MNKLWHKDIRFPSFYTAPTHRAKLEWSRHALLAGMEDRYGIIPVFKTLPLGQFETIEVETSGQDVVKILVRGHFDSTRDVVFALKPKRDGGMFVKTVWFQKRNDLHKTLDRSKYQA